MARREREEAERGGSGVSTGEMLRQGSFADRREGAVLPDDDNDDSSDDEREVNVMGREVPLEWYKEEDHVGYTVDGERIMKPEAQDKMTGLIKRNIDPNAWRTIYDEYNGTTVTLTDAEIRMIRRLRRNRYPHSDVDPYPVKDFDVSVERDANGKVVASPLSSAPEPKRRFLPSKWEAKMVVRMVRAMRKGWMKMRSEEEAERQDAARDNVYLMWGDGADEESARTGAGLPYIPAPKVKLPGHEESYNPPEEYLPTEEERAKWESGLEEKPQFVPQRYTAMRLVPAYSDFINERFDRCLDLYLCPRTRRKRLDVNPEDLKPRLPDPSELRPFPTTLSVVYRGHTGAVRCLAAHPAGQWLATGGDDGSVRLWEVMTGRCVRVWRVGNDAGDAAEGDGEAGGGVVAIAWCPRRDEYVLCACSGYSLFILEASAGAGDDSDEDVDGTDDEDAGAGGCRRRAKRILEDALEAAATTAADQNGDKAEADEEEMSAATGKKLVQWSRWRGADGSTGIRVRHKFRLRDVAWHYRGDYFSTVCPEGNTASVLVHQLSKAASQCPFKKLKGRVVRTLFHPSKPIFFVATRYHIRVYHLQRQALMKKLQPNMNGITRIAVHPGGDNIIACSSDARTAWLDMDLSTKPYKSLRHHSACVHAASFHRSLPLFATAGDDGNVHVFHGMVYADLLQNALIVPVKILRGHEVVDSEGIFDVCFHPQQPWVFSAGADATARLYYN